MRPKGGTVLRGGSEHTWGGCHATHGRQTAAAVRRAGSVFPSRHRAPATSQGTSASPQQAKSSCHCGRQVRHTASCLRHSLPALPYPARQRPGGMGPSHPQAAQGQTTHPHQLPAAPGSAGPSLRATTQGHTICWHALGSTFHGPPVSSCRRQCASRARNLRG